MSIGLSAAFRIALFLAALVSGGCTPALNWRLVRLPPTDVTALFPCRPQSEARRLDLAGRGLVMRLTACQADGATYALADLNVVDVSDSSDAERVAGELRDRSTSNIHGSEGPTMAWRVAGAGRVGQRVVVAGRWPNGDAVIEHRATIESRGHVYRMSVMGKALPAEAVEPFFGGLVLSPR